MFTGIIEEQGTVQGVERFGGGRRLTIQASFAHELEPDESVAVNGACQTVVAQEENTFTVVAVEETLRKTTLGHLSLDDAVNLERALQPSDRFDGHFVQGHVDATGTVTAVEEEETNRLFRIAFDEQFAPYLIPVGSITIDGISLTVARLDDDELTVAVIPHTYELTTASSWQEGTRVNLEFDMIGKYVVRWLQTRPSQSQEGPSLSDLAL